MTILRLSKVSRRDDFETRQTLTFTLDSSRRAVEAADNVVHAYDLNMQVPDTPNHPNDDDSMEVASPASSGRRPSILIEGKSIFFRRSKRQRTSDSGSIGPAPKQRHLEPRSSAASTPIRDVSPHTRSLRSAVEESDNLTGATEGVVRQGPGPTLVEPGIALVFTETEPTATPGLRHTQVRELLHVVINESLRVGGRPESAVAEEMDGGEIIDVRTRDPNGDLRTKIIEWSVDPQVPDTIFSKLQMTLPLDKRLTEQPR